ncbi:hypothetical protein D3C80_2013710 [compost metagenome]
MIIALNRKRVPGSRTSAYLTDEALHPNFDYISTLAIRGNLPMEGKGGQNAIFSRIGVRTYIYK